MSGRLQDKVAVITGGASGMGLATAKRYLQEGAKVVIGDLNAASGDTAMGQLAEAGLANGARFIKVDVAQEADIEAMIALAVSQFGGLDILFNNAGHGGAMGGVEETDVKAWDDTFALLVRGPALGMKHAAPLMRARGGGAIVNTASIAGLQAGFGPLAYSAAKAAVIQLTRVAAAELSPMNIRVNAICPGLIATSIFGASFGLPRENADQMAAQIEEVAPKFQPVPKAGLPRDIAEAALYLASNASAFVSGTHLVVDGALTIGPRSAWAADSVSPILEALGITPEQAQAMQAARKAALAAG